LDEAHELVNETGERYFEPELQRISGELHLAECARMATAPHAAPGRRAAGGAAAAEDCFRRAVETARSRESRSLELRAATSLGRLLAATGRPGDARELLLPLYESFSEGLDTPDLKDARALLESASHP
jgi:adenylate cyclase